MSRRWKDIERQKGWEQREKPEAMERIVMNPHVSKITISHNVDGFAILSLTQTAKGHVRIVTMLLTKGVLEDLLEQVVTVKKQLDTHE